MKTASSATVSFLRVRLGDAMLAVPALAVREIVRAVAITPLAGAPPLVEGAVNLRGELVPVLDIRARLALPSRAIDPDQFLVMITLGTRTLAMRVDDVDDLVEVERADIERTDALSPTLRGVAGLSARADGVLVIYDPASFVSAAESEALDAAIASGG